MTALAGWESDKDFRLVLGGDIPYGKQGDRNGGRRFSWAGSFKAPAQILCVTVKEQEMWVISACNCERTNNVGYIRLPLQRIKLRLPLLEHRIIPESRFLEDSWHFPKAEPHMLRLVRIRSNGEDFPAQLPVAF